MTKYENINGIKCLLGGGRHLHSGVILRMSFWTHNYAQLPCEGKSSIWRIHVLHTGLRLARCILGFIRSDFLAPRLSEKALWKRIGRWPRRKVLCSLLSVSMIVSQEADPQHVDGTLLEGMRYETVGGGSLFGTKASCALGLSLVCHPENGHAVPPVSLESDRKSARVYFFLTYLC